MNNYLQRLGLTAWRKKTTVLVIIAILTLIMYGLHYTQSYQFKNSHVKEGISEAIAEQLKQNYKINIKFVDHKSQTGTEADNLIEGILHKLSNHYRIIGRGDITEDNKITHDTDHLLGIPSVNLNLESPYIPKKRIVHFDLKGAPLQVGFYRKIFPMIKNMGATGILLEYEDMFPYTGILKSVPAHNAYTLEQIKEILTIAEELKLEVIPLVQTFGHLEYVLKHSEFIKYREVPGSPQALCPSRNASIDIVLEIVNQIVSAHPNINYLHIGCDEVYQMGECEICRLELHETLFLRHVRNVANLIHDKYPKLKIIIWDDMLRHLSQQTMLEMNLGALVEPMIWVYAEDIYRFVQPQIWEKYATIFRSAWTASAFKGAFGETLYIPDAKRHLENNLRWLEIMSQQSSRFRHGITGIALTGWQRYDHFAVLCELFPAGIPSLALSLFAISNGFFNSSLKSRFLASLSCPQTTVPRNSPFINLDSDPHLWEKLGRCMFPGSPLFRLMFRLHTTETEVSDYLRLVNREKGWMTEYNIRHNYSLPLRVDELISDLPRVYHSVISLARSAADTMAGIFDNYTIAEWVEQRIYPYVVSLEKIQNDSSILKSVNTWPSRPLPILRDLQRLGVLVF